MLIFAISDLVILTQMPLLMGFEGGEREGEKSTITIARKALVERCQNARTKRALSGIQVTVNYRHFLGRKKHLNIYDVLCSRESPG